jgi:hypothetical protein
MHTVVRVALGLLISSVAQAQTVAPDFPAEARVVGAEALRERLAGKVFHVAVANGNTWRFQYQAGGDYYLNVSSGYSDSGKWRTEESKICFEPQKSKAGCNEVRLVGEMIHFKRDSGEIVKFELR